MLAQFCCDQKREDVRFGSLYCGMKAGDEGLYTVFSFNFTGHFSPHKMLQSL